MKTTKIVTIVILAFVALSLTSFMVVGIVTGFSGWEFANRFSMSIGDNPAYNNTVEFPGDQIDKLDIDWASGRIEVTVADNNSDKIFVTEIANSDLRDSEKMQCSASGNTLKIKEISRWRFFNFFSPIKHVTVVVPKNLIKDLKIDTASAEVFVSGMTECKIDTDSASGEITVENSTCTKLNLANVSGEIETIAVTTQDAKLESVSGNIVGELSLSGELDANTVSGGVELNLPLSPSELDIETVSGSVRLSLPEEGGFKVKFDTVSGGFNCEMPISSSGGYYIYGDGTKEYKVDTVSGSFNILKYLG